MIFMETFGLNKLFNKLGEALNIFDFSFFISGFVTLCIIAIGVSAHVGLSWFVIFTSLPIWMATSIFLISIYVCGLVSWMIGKEMRKVFLFDGDQEGNSEQNDFAHIYDDLVSSLRLQGTTMPQFTNKMDIYYYMWIKLDSIQENENVKGRLAYCNRLWVMRALFEGLLFSCLLGIFLLIDLVFFVRSFGLYGIWYSVFGFFVIIVLMYFADKTANNYAHSQIKEIVVAYKVYILEASRE